MTSVGADANAYSDLSVSADTTYYYRVRAYNGSGYSVASNVDSDTTPAASGITLTTTGYKIKGWHNVHLEWDDVSPVNIYRNNQLLLESVSGETYLNADIAKGSATYTYEVCRTASPNDCSNESQVVF